MMPTRIKLLAGLRRPVLDTLRSQSRPVRLLRSRGTLRCRREILPRTPSSASLSAKRRRPMRPKPRSVPLLCILFTVALALAWPASAWAAPQYKVLHAFTGGKDGGGLWGSLLLDNRGNLYGTTVLNTVFELIHIPAGSGA